MSQREPWTNDVSNHVMDAQAIVRRAMHSGEVDPVTGARMLAAFEAAQKTITKVHETIVEATKQDADPQYIKDVLRYGEPSARLRRRLRENHPEVVNLRRRRTDRIAA